MTTHLVVCRSLGSLPALDRIQVQPGVRLVAASDDPGVHAGAQHRGIEAVWLEDLEAYFAVADEVKRITDAITGWLRSFGDADRGVPARLLFWVKHAEGGLTTQRIQDLLLLVGAYRRLLATVRPAAVTVVRSGGDAWESRVLAACAEAVGIPCTIVGSARPAALLKDLRAWSTAALRLPYAFAMWLACRLTGQSAPSDAAVVIQLCDSAPKHVIYNGDWMAAIAATGVSVRAVCWRAVRGAKQLRARGLAADDLERWVSLGEWFAGVSRARRTWRAIRRQRRDFEQLPSLRYDGVACGALLWPSIQWFCRTDLPSRMHLAIGAERYFRTHPPRMAKFWTTILPQGVIAYESIPPNARPLVFHGPAFPYDIADPYSGRTIPVDLELAISDDHADRLAGDEFPSRRIVTVGFDRLGPAQEYGRSHTAAESRVRFGLDPRGGRVILYDPGYILRGYMSAREQMRITEAVLDAAARDSSIVVLVKPHPSHRRGPLEDQIRRARLPNVSLVPAAALPHDCINAVDVIVTKYSTIGVEAMVIDRPVISVLLDGIGFRAFGDAAQYVDDTTALTELLVALRDTERFAAWRAARAARAVDYLQRTIFRSARSPVELMAAAVHDMLHDFADASPIVGSGANVTLKSRA